MPVIVVWVVWNFVVVKVLAFQEGTSDLNKSLGSVNFLWSTSLVFVLSWDPSSNYNNSRSIDANHILSFMFESLVH